MSLVVALLLAASRVQGHVCWVYSTLPAVNPQPWVVGSPCPVGTGCSSTDALLPAGSTGPGYAIGHEHRNWHCSHCIPSLAAPATSQEAYGRAFLAFHRQFILDFDNWRLANTPWNRLEIWDAYANVPVPGDDETTATPFTHCSDGVSVRPAGALCTGCANMPSQFVGGNLASFSNLGEVGYALEIYWHGSFHNGVTVLGCDDIGGFVYTPRDPAFWMAHKKLDEVSRDWQSLQAVDVVIVIDRSGSMDDNCSSTTPPPNETPCAINDAKEAARTFANFVLDTRLDGAVPAAQQHRVGLVSFSSAATTELDLTLANGIVTDNNVNDTLFEQKLAAIATGGGTSIGAGIRQALTILHAVPDPNPHQAILVLTDGKENTPPCLGGNSPSACVSPDVLTQAEIGEVQIVAIGIGEGAEEANLRDVAERHGGIFVAQANGNDALSLQKFFATAFGEIFDSPVSSDPRGTMETGQFASAPFPINICGDERLSVLLGFEGREPRQGTNCDLQLELFTPSGKRVNRTDPGVEAGHGERHDFMHVNLPYLGEQTGVWSGRVVRPTASNTNCPRQGYFYSALVKGFGRVRPFVLRPKVSVGRRILASFRISESSRPIGGFDLVNAMVTLTRPDGTQETYPLFDDGTQGDTLANNHIWSFEIPVPALQPGPHHLRAHFELTHAGCTRVREAEYSIVAEREPVDCTRVVAGGPPTSYSLHRLQPGALLQLDELFCLWNRCASSNQYRIEVHDSQGWLRTRDRTGALVPVPDSFVSGAVQPFDEQCFGLGPEEGNPGGGIPLLVAVPANARPGDQSLVTIRVASLTDTQPAITVSNSILVFPPPDCNNNGVDDAVDIARGTSRDDNRNGQPDECDETGHFGIPDVATLIPFGSDWKYLDNGSDQGTAWRGRGFDDTRWLSGPAELGFGDGDESTVINGGPATSRFITTYFRHAFVFTDVGPTSNLLARVKRDDGAVGYLNGVAIFRDNMPTGAPSFTTLASSEAADDGGKILEFAVPPSLLAKGSNVVAVEVHQQSRTNSDLSFDLELLAFLEHEEPPTILVQPQSRTVPCGVPVTFGVTASGTPPLGYQWRLNGTAIAGATSSSYTVEFPNVASAGRYSVMVNNAAGSDLSADAVLSLLDTVPPRILCPSDRVVWACSTNGATVTYRAFATDNMHTNVAVVCAPPSGSLFPPGNTRVSCTATDDCGHRGTCSFSVTVLRDTTPPGLACPTNRNLWATSTNGAAVYYTVTARDDGDLNPRVGCVPPSGSFFGVGSRTVVCTATDKCGNSNTCSFTVRVMAVQLNIAFAPGMIALAWSEPAALQSAAQVTGPWRDVPDAKSPYRILPGVAAQLFFRLRDLIDLGPAISGFSPGEGLPGTIVRIEGSGFDPDPFKNIVRLGGSLARVISGGTTQLRVVALRDVASGPIEVTVGADTAVSAQPFKRAGTTTFATPLEESDSQLIVGQSYDVTQRYDMSAQGLNQKVLVVLASPTDINPEDYAPMGQTARDAILDVLADANVYFNQASYNQVSADFDVTADWIPLSQIRDFYCWQQEDVDAAQAQVDAAQAALDALMLDPNATAQDIEDAEADVDAAQEKLNTALDAQNKLQEPDFFFAEALLGAKAVTPNFDDYPDYFVVLAGPFMRGQNLGTETGFHAESQNPNLNIGPFDIDFPAPKGITYVPQTEGGGQVNWGRVVHELSHFFSGGDLYAQSYADGSYLEGTFALFDMMGSHNSHPLYGAYNVVTRLDYFNESANGNVVFLDWGSVADFDETYDLVAHAKTQDPAGDAVQHMIRMQVTEGLVYLVEVRQQPDPPLGAASDYVFDTDIPLDPSNPAWKGGVVMSYATENNFQSSNKERPVQLLPPQRMMQEGESFYDPARTIRFTVSQKLADRPAQYRIRVEWGHLPAADPNGQFDLRIAPWGAPPWETEDIWANSLKNDETTPPKIIYQNHEPGDETAPIGNGDPPWVGHDNTLYARVENQGEVETPENVLVTFYLNSPPGVGDSGEWELFDTVDVGKLAPNTSVIVAAARKWRPSVGEHTCIKVEIHPQTGEITFDNNQAQENFSQFETGAASPYEPFELTFLARNPYTRPGVMDLRARNVPKDWFVAFDHGSVWLPSLSTKPVHVVIWTDRVAEWEVFATQVHTNPARKAEIQLEGWMDRFGDLGFPVGGITAFGQAVRKVEIRIAEHTGGQGGQPFGLAIHVVPQVGVVPLAVHITDPDGNLITERTQTGATSQVVYVTKYKPTKSGLHKVQAFVLAGALAGEAESLIHDIVVP